MPPGKTAPLLSTTIWVKLTWPRHWKTKGRFTLSTPLSAFEMLDSTCPIDAMETNEEHKNSLDGTELIDGNQVVEGEVVGNNEMDGEDDVDGEDVGLGVGQPSQQPH